MDWIRDLLPWLVVGLAWALLVSVWRDLSKARVEIRAIRARIEKGAPLTPEEERAVAE